MSTKTELELRKEYADMLTMLATPGWEKRIEARILAKGRTEMHQLLAFLFVRCASAEIELMRLKATVSEIVGDGLHTLDVLEEQITSTPQ